MKICVRIIVGAINSIDLQVTILNLSLFEILSRSNFGTANVAITTIAPEIKFHVLLLVKIGSVIVWSGLKANRITATRAMNRIKNIRNAPRYQP